MSLEPLADHLEPQFGNIYEFNLKDAGSFEVQEWTDELRQVVKPLWSSRPSGSAVHSPWLRRVSVQ